MSTVPAIPSAAPPVAQTAIGPMPAPLRVLRGGDPVGDRAEARTRRLLAQEARARGYRGAVRCGRCGAVALDPISSDLHRGPTCRCDEPVLVGVTETVAYLGRLTAIQEEDLRRSAEREVALLDRVAALEAMLAEVEAIRARAVEILTVSQVEVSGPVG